MLVFDTDSLSTFQHTGVIWQNLYNTGGGGGGGSETLQDVLDNGSTLNKSNSINAAGNNISFDNLNEFYINESGSGYNTTFGVIPGTTFLETSGANGIVGWSPTVGGDSLNTYLTQTAGWTDFGKSTQHQVDIFPTHVEIRNNTNGANADIEHAKLVLVDADTLLTTPDYIAVFENDTIKKYPYSGGGGGSETFDQVLANGSTLTDNRIVDLNGNSLSFSQNGNNLLSINPIDFETSIYSSDGTAQGGIVTINNSSIADVRTELFSADGGNVAQLSLNGVSKTITYDANTHTFTGKIINASDSNGIPHNIAYFDGDTLKRAAYPDNDEVNVLNFGVVADGVTPAQAGINAAVNYARANNYKKVRIPKGDYGINGAIRLKDSIHLIADGAIVTLLPYSHAYMITNDDLTNGNTNIEVSGGIWKGGFGTQQLRFSTTSLIDTSYYGFGMHFYKVKNLSVHNLKIDSSQTWGIAHIGCNNFYFGHIRFKQALRRSWNGDGVSGSSSNGLIEDISGYTNDDMVGILATPGGFGAQVAGLGNYPVFDAQNIIIRDIRSELLDSAYVNQDTAYTQRAVRIFSGYGHFVKNVIVDGITGTTWVNPVQIDSYDSTGKFYNITVSNVNVDQRTRASTEFGSITMKNVAWAENIVFNNITRKERTLSSHPVFLVQNVAGESINISNVNSVNQGVTGEFLYDRNSSVRTFNLTNIYHSDSLMTTANVLYRKNNGSITRFKASSISVKDTTGLFLKEGTATFSVNSTSVIVDTTLLTPQVSDVINGRNIGTAFYTGKWNFMPTTSAQFANNINDETGTGVVAFNTNATFLGSTANQKILIGNQTSGGASSTGVANVGAGFGFGRSSDGAYIAGIFNYNDNAGTPDLGIRGRNNITFWNSTTNTATLSSTGFSIGGNVTLSAAGNKLNIATGTNASVGISGAMTAGTITISTTAVTASSRIFLTHASTAGTLGELYVGTIVAGTSFVINSSSATDTGTVNWFIIN